MDVSQSNPILLYEDCGQCIICIYAILASTLQLDELTWWKAWFTYGLFDFLIGNFDSRYCGHLFSRLVQNGSTLYLLNLVSYYMRDVVSSNRELEWLGWLRYGWLELCSMDKCEYYRLLTCPSELTCNECGESTFWILDSKRGVRKKGWADESSRQRWVL